MTTPIKILHLEDIRSDADLIAREIGKSALPYNVLWVTNKNDFGAALKEFDPHIVLSDHSLPTITSVVALEMVKAHNKEIPFILLTSTVSEEFAVSMMKAGISDYILKDRLQRLPTAITHALEKVNADKQKTLHYKQIESQEKKFRALIENTHEAIVLTDSDLKIKYRSPSATKITGWSSVDREEIGFINSTHPDDIEKFRSAIEQIISEPGSSFTITFRSLHKAGHYIWLELTMKNLLQDEDVKAIVTNFRDVTERIESEEELRKTGKHFQALIENISDAILLIDAKGAILYHSPSVKRITDFSMTEQSDLKIFDFIQDDDQAEAREVFNKVVLNPDEPVQHTFKLRKKDGSFVWAEGTITNLLEDESVGAFVINYRDVTERKKAEEKLQKSEANLRTIYNNTNISYVLIDTDYKVVSFNELAVVRYNSQLQVDLSEGMNLLYCVGPERREETIERFMAVLSGKKITYEQSFTDTNESQHWFHVDMSPVFNEVHKIIGLVVSSEDITERKIDELEKEKMTEDLVRHNKNLEQFAYIISHNLRSPVANIIGLSNILQDYKSINQTDLERCLEGIISSIKKLDDVIIDLNYILESRRELSATKEIVSLPALLDDIKTIISAQIEKENIIIETDFEAGKIFTVRSYLHSIFLNLIANSIKYRDPAKQTIIHISSRRLDGKIVISFRDNGLGIDLKAHGDKLFGLYKKFHFHMDGKGMGLYMVKTQVEMLGGNISVKSQVNEGAEFSVEFFA